MPDLYADYLISSFGLTTATGMSAALGGTISHDDITRFLSEREYTNKDRWKLVKPTIRQIETDDGILALDDTIEEKQYTDENDIIAWHYDQATVPLGFCLVKKDVPFTDLKTGKQKRRSSVTKNEQARELIGAAIHNQVRFRYCLADSWFSAQENREFIVGKGKHCIFALKTNRTFAETKEDKLQGVFHGVESLAREENTTKTGYLKGMDMPVRITRQVFMNGDGSQGVLYLATSDLTPGHTDIATIYQKRWKVEEYHKSNLGLARSPTKRVTTQRNHCFAATYAYHTLEGLAKATT